MIHFLTIRYISQYRCDDTIHISIHDYINEYNGKTICDGLRVLSLGAQAHRQAQCKHRRQKYKDLHENPDKKLKKIFI